MRSTFRILLVVAALAAAGCAALTPIEGPPIGGLMPVSGKAADSARAASDAIPVPPPITLRSVPADSTPSADARAVLATIPEPLAPGERVPPPDTVVADSAAADTSGVPTPAPTRAMGDQELPPIESAAPATPAALDTCWRIQIAAPETADEAEDKRRAAESLLVTGFLVEKDGPLFKVRSRQCVGRTAALALQGRALASGFAGAFPFALIKP